MQVYHRVWLKRDQVQIVYLGPNHFNLVGIVLVNADGIRVADCVHYLTLLELWRSVRKSKKEA